jgi:hypothetical protein
MALGATSLLSEDPLDLPNLFLHFAGDLFGRAFGLELGVVSHLPDSFLELTLGLVERAFSLILRS